MKYHAVTPKATLEEILKKERTDDIVSEDIPFADEVTAEEVDSAEVPFFEEVPEIDEQATLEEVSEVKQAPDSFRADAKDKMNSCRKLDIGDKVDCTLYYDDVRITRKGVIQKVNFLKNGYFYDIKLDDGEFLCLHDTDVQKC